jgi:predicted acyl esterase
MVHGYGDSKETLANFCRDQASYGYYTMTFSVRGQGHSGGFSNLISDIEALDLLEIIQWVKNDSINGSCPGKILIMGGSQGGLLPMKAACMGGQPVKTIISSVAPPNFASSWIENGSIKMTALWTMDYTPDTAKYTQQVVNMRNWIFANTKPLWDSLARTMPIGRDFVSSLGNCQIPVLIEGSWQDKFFNSQGWLDNITSLNVPLSSYLGAVHGHGGDQSLAEDTWHMNWFNNWFFQWIWDMPTPILDQAKYQYAYTTFPVNGQYWSFVHDSSTVPLKNASTNVRLYFNENRRLRTTYDNKENNYFQIKNTVSTGYTLQQAIDEEFKGTNFTQKFKVDSVSFLSDPLAAPLKWVGVPSVKLDYSSTAATFCQYDFQIYEVLSNGQQRFINRVNYTDRNYTKGQRKTATFKGQGHAHMFQAGSKIKIKVTNLDRVKEDSAFFDGTNPFVLPVTNTGTHNLYVSSNSYIDLPVMGGVNYPFHMVNNEDGESNLNSPYSFKLSQNFPNPFNPSTMIEYSIAAQEKVQLKVYDVLGREVTTLVNEVQNPGSYNVTFNASQLSSGIYFYKIISGSFTDIKKMVLVK